MVSLASLGIFLVPLIALLLSFDAIVGEAERGTLLLLLAYPVARWQVVLGKFLGHLAVLVVATLVGYGGAAAAAVAVRGGGGAVRPGAPSRSSSPRSVLLGGVFLGLGLLASVWVRERQTAAGVALGIWLSRCVLFDMALLGAARGDRRGGAVGRARDRDHDAEPGRRVPPAQPRRLQGRELAAGMAGVVPAGTAGPPLLVAVLLLWTALPVAAAWLGFRRREP